jgi:uncharacterized protein DUF3106
MRRKLQLAGWLLALGMSAAVAVPCLAQGPRVYRVQNRPVNRPPKAPKQQARQQQRQPQQKQNSGANRPPNSNANRSGPATQSNNPNRPPSSYTPPPRKFNELSPQEKQRVIENNRRYQNLSPAQKQELNGRIDNWNRLTPQQKDHIRNDVMPKWRQMPVERRQAIRQRLRVLQNMPEAARNQRLNDPNFTRGMSEEDKATLHDLSHMHVGGAPEPPSE